jgi:hypothetical protein
MNIMLDGNFFAKSNEIFVDLLNLANEELCSKGMNIEPSVIVDKIISPLKHLYLNNLNELLESFMEKKFGSDQTSSPPL